MARTKGITLRVRRPEQDPLPETAADEASTSFAEQQTQDASPVRGDDPEAAVEEEGGASPTRSRRLSSSRSRNARLSRTRSHEQAFGQDATLAQASPSRKSRRQLAKHEKEDEEMPPADEMESNDQGQMQDEEAFEQDLDASPPTSRSRSSRSRARTTATPKSRSTPRKSVRAPTAASSRPTRSRLSAAATAQGDEEEEEGGELVDSEQRVDEDEEEEDGDAEADADADVDADGDGDEDEETGIDVDGHDTITIKGQVYRMDGDEVILPSDPDGDKKVDEKGRLQGGRQYKAYNFTSELRDDPEKVYMLSIDAARAAGYRDSLYFFRKNPQILKIELYQGEKDKLIEDGRLSGQLKSRNVTMVAARNVYKLHGARFLSGGKAVIDDYYEADARASGVKEGKPVGGMSAEDQEKKREADRDRERPKKKADTFVYTTIDPQGDPVLTVFGDAGQPPWTRAGGWQSRKAALQRSDITEENWMLEMARSVQGMNTELSETRKGRLSAFPRFNRYVGLEGTVAVKAEEVDLVADGDADPEDDPEAINDLPPWEREQMPAKTEAQMEEEVKKRKAAEIQEAETKRRRGPPVGVYEPHTHLPHFSMLTQPTWCTMEKTSLRPLYVEDPGREAGDRRPILGGDRMGSGGWGVSSFSFESLPPAPLPAYRRVHAGADLASFRQA